PRDRPAGTPQPNSGKPPAQGGRGSGLPATPSAASALWLCGGGGRCGRRQYAPAVEIRESSFSDAPSVGTSVWSHSLTRTLSSSLHYHTAYRQLKNRPRVM